MVDGDARPIGWADPERPGQVFPLGSTFSPETDSLRGALDSALTSPFGVAVAVTADTQRYAGVVSADAILDKVRDVRTSIAESISIREAETAHEFEPLAEADTEYSDVGEPDYAAETEAEAEQTEQVESAEVDPVEAYAPPLDEAARSEVEAKEVSLEGTQAAGESFPEAQSDQIADDTISIEQPESISEESEPGETAPGEDHPTADGHREGQEANGEAHYRRGSGVLQ
jgi:osmoprotectant transport system ATP-binding protein